MSQTPVHVSIGVLAWNEESSIAATVASIFRQQLLQSPPDWLASAEVLVVPNGCTDATASLASKAIADGLAGLADAQGNAEITGRVHEITTASKGAAWNAFVHEASQPRADILILMDGDVLIDHPDTLTNMCLALDQHPEAHVAGAQPIKTISRKRSWHPLHWLSLKASEIRKAMPGTFAGALYAGRASALRAFRLPTVLIGEDEFIRAMMVTDYFTHEDDTSRVTTAENATVLFEAYVSPRQVFRNLVRRNMTLAIDGVLFAAFWHQAMPDRHAGHLTIEWDRDTPGWDVAMLKDAIENQQWRARPWRQYAKWLKRLKPLPTWKKLALLPIALVAGTLDAAAEAVSIRKFRRGEVTGLWFETKTNLS